MTNQTQPPVFGARSTDNQTRTRSRSRRSRLPLRPVLALVFVLATSCGSSGSTESSDASANESSDQTTATTEANGDDQATAASDDTPAAAGGTGLGVIEIDGVRHELEIIRCFSMAGAIGGDGVGVDDPDNEQVSFSFSPEDWTERNASEGWDENGTVRLDSEEPYLQWESGQSLFSGINLPDSVDTTELDITSYDIADDEQSVTGEAMFLELNALVMGNEATPTPGTFSFSCPPEG